MQVHLLSNAKNFYHEIPLPEGGYQALLYFTQGHFVVVTAVSWAKYYCLKSLLHYSFTRKPYLYLLILSPL